MPRTKESYVEAGRKGGLKKNKNKGFGSNRELAREAGRKRWANRRKQDEEG